MDFTELRHLAEQIETECGKAIIGKGEQIRLVLTSLFAGGHVLIDDIPCLLYTSPSPRDGATSRMPSSA